MTTTIDIFIIYDYEDENLLKQLEKQFSVLKRESIVNIWHDRNISAGQEREPVISTYLNTADIILLLISPDFMASQHCYHEMKRAIERYELGEAKVIPIILRPVDWAIAPFNKLQVLPIGGKPITTWRNRDEAFSHVAKAIHQGIEEFKEEPCSSEPSGNPSNKTLLPFSQLTVEAKQPILKPLSNSKGQQRWQSFLRFPRRKTLTFLAGLIIATGGGISLSKWIVTQAQSNWTSQTNTSPQSIQDQNLAVQFIGTQQSTLALSGDPMKHSPNQLSKQGVPALCIDQNKQQSVFRITIGISNLRRDQYVLLIQQVQLIVERITFIPRPLYVLAQSLPVLSNYNLYRALYIGQDPNTRLLTKYDNPPNDYVRLTLHETDKISVQVASSVEVFLSFRVAITYQVANEGQTHTLTLPNIFQVIFTHKSNWHPYQVQDGRFTQLDTP